MNEYLRQARSTEQLDAVILAPDGPTNEAAITRVVVVWSRAPSPRSPNRSGWSIALRLRFAVRVYERFFDKLIGHSKVEEAYKYYTTTGQQH